MKNLEQLIDYYQDSAIVQIAALDEYAKKTNQTYQSAKEDLAGILWDYDEIEIECIPGREDDGRIIFHRMAKSLIEYQYAEKRAYVERSDVEKFAQETEREIDDVLQDIEHELYAYQFEKEENGRIIFHKI